MENHSACQNCAKVWRDSELKPIQDLSQRVEAGEPMPSGECPECGALCQPAKLRFQVPKMAIEFWVDKFHVSTPDEIVRVKIREKFDGATWYGKPLTFSQMRRIESYAVKRHHKNVDLYAFVMGGH